MKMRKHAKMSDCKVYRYWLERVWAEYGRGFVNFVLLNPSTADDVEDDPTVRKCIGFARRWGYMGMHIVNLFALRATDPKALTKHPDPIGPDNWIYLEVGRESAEITVVAWGCHGSLHDRARSVLPLLGDVYALGVNKDGSPKHPLGVPYDRKPELYKVAG